MALALDGKKIAFLVANEGVEQVELTTPWSAVKESGAVPYLLAPEAGQVQAYNHLDAADRFDVDLPVADVHVEDYDALVLPGGVANPDRLRTDACCRGLRPRFRRVRSPGRRDLPRALDTGRGRCGARPHLDLVAELANRHRERRRTWVDEQVHVDGNLISSRRPDDLDAFCRTLVDAVTA